MVTDELPGAINVPVQVSVSQAKHTVRLSHMECNNSFISFQPFDYGQMLQCNAEQNAIE